MIYFIRCALLISLCTLGCTAETRENIGTKLRDDVGPAIRSIAPGSPWAELLATGVSVIGAVLVGKVAHTSSLRKRALKANIKGVESSGETKVKKAIRDEARKHGVSGFLEEEVAKEGKK